jgi:hypothetical protein
LPRMSNMLNFASKNVQAAGFQTGFQTKRMYRYYLRVHPLATGDRVHRNNFATLLRCLGGEARVIKKFYWRWLGIGTILRPCRVASEAKHASLKSSIEDDWACWRPGCIENLLYRQPVRRSVWTLLVARVHASLRLFPLKMIRDVDVRLVRTLVRTPSTHHLNF